MLFRSYLRSIVVFIAFSCLFYSVALAQDAPDCADQSASAKVERQATKWESQSLGYGKADGVAKKIDARIANGKLVGCDLARMELAKGTSQAINLYISSR